MLARAALIMVGVGIGLAAVALTRPGTQAAPAGTLTLTGPGLDVAYITLNRPAPRPYGVFVRSGSGWIRIDGIARGSRGTLIGRSIGAAAMIRVGTAPTQSGLVAVNLDVVRRDGIAAGLLLDRVQLLAPSCDRGVLAQARQAAPILQRLASPAALSAAQALRRVVRAVTAGRCQAVRGPLAALAEAAPTLAQVPLRSG